MKLISENVGGNIHDAVAWVNKLGLARYVLHMESVTGSNSIVVLRVPDEFTIDRWWYDRATPEQQAAIVAREIWYRQQRGERT